MIGCVWLSVFDIYRCPYFYMSEILLTAVPTAVQFIVVLWLIVEVAEPGSEGIAYGTLTTMNNLPQVLSPCQA